MANVVTNKRLVVILGDSEVAPRILSSVSQEVGSDTSIWLATPEHGPPLPVEAVHPAVDYVGPVSREQSEMLASESAHAQNFLITCYWPWLVPGEALQNYDGRTLNFHPAPLPQDRGWYPHVHQIRSGSPSGVTLHQLSPEPDEGNVWCQEFVDVPFPSTALQARKALQEAITQLFVRCWPDVWRGTIWPRPQTGQVSYRKKLAVENFDHLPRDQEGSVEEIIRMLACRNFGKRSFVSIPGDNGQRFVHINFSLDGHLPDFE